MPPHPKLIQLALQLHGATQTAAASYSTVPYGP
uniref:LysR family transcriptional regulator n=1 Tax=Macrostomum lignano TaxID=282301 RepID=A0A1I8FGT1_9PLAT